MKKPAAGVWGAVAVLAAGGVFFFYSLAYPYTSEIGPGPGFFPLWLSGLLLVLGLFYLAAGLRGKDSAERMPDARGFRKILFILGSMALYVLLLPLLGFVAASALFLFALLFRAYKPPVNAAVSVGTSVFLYLLFAVFLGVKLPLNALGF